MKRPLWTIGLCLALGTLAAALFPLRLSLGIGAVCLILAVGAVCLPEGRHTAVPLCRNAATPDTMPSFSGRAYLPFLERAMRPQAVSASSSFCSAA